VDAALAEHADQELLTHGYVIAETLAMARRRFGSDGAAVVVDDLLPQLRVLPIDEPTFNAALEAFRVSIESATSFVDHITIAVVRSQAIDTVVALDPDLAVAGVTVVPG